MSQISHRDYPDYVIGVQLNLPINNRSARADMARDQLQYRRSEVQLDKLRSQIRLQVGNARIALQQAQESVRAAIEARTLQEQATVVERAKFDAGVSTAYEFLRYQSALAQVKSAAVTALGIYEKARTALDRANESTLVAHHVVVEDGVSSAR